MNIKTIEAYQLVARLADAKPPLVINVLTPDYYEDCHIARSINVPLAGLEKHVSSLDKNQEIIVYCAHEKCAASRKAYDLLTRLGFTNVYAYEGGMRDWKHKNLECSGACEQEYLQ